MCFLLRMSPPDIAVIPQGPAEPGRVLGTLSPSLSGISHPYSQLSPARACRLPPSVPRGLRLGVAGPFGSCPELLVTSYLLPWDWVCCWAGQREVTRLRLGAPARKPPQDTSWVLPQPTRFRGHLASPALLGEVGRVTACLEALFPPALFFQLPVSMVLPERAVSTAGQRGLLIPAPDTAPGTETVPTNIC